MSLKIFFKTVVNVLSLTLAIAKTKLLAFVLLPLIFNYKRLSLSLNKQNAIPLDPGTFIDSFLCFAEATRIAWI